MNPSLCRPLGPVGLEALLAHGLARFDLAPSAARSRASACLVALIMLVGCDGSRLSRVDAAHFSDDAAPSAEDAEAPPELPDSGDPFLDAAASVDADLADDATTAADALLPTDAPPQADAPLSTLTPIPCDQTCTDAEACIDGDCLKRCGADVEALRAALPSLLEVHFATCDTGAVAQAVPRDTLNELYVKEGTTLSFGYRADSVNPFSSTLEVTPALPAGVTLIPSPFLRLVPNGPLLFGYTTSAPGAPGGLFVVPKLGLPDAGVSELSAPGNRAATLAGTKSALEPDVFFVIADGLGAANEGAGVYRGSIDGGAPSLALRNVAAPQSITARGDFAQYLLIGALPPEGTTWPDGSGGSRVFVIRVDELAGAPVDVLTHEKVAHFSDLPAELEASRSQDEVAFITRDPLTHTIATLDVRRLVLNEGAPKFSAATRWVTGGSFTSFARTGYGTALLRHAHGTWFIRVR